MHQKNCSRQYRMRRHRTKNPSIGRIQYSQSFNTSNTGDSFFSGNFSGELMATSRKGSYSTKCLSRGRKSTTVSTMMNMPVNRGILAPVFWLPSNCSLFDPDQVIAPHLSNLPHLPYHTAPMETPASNIPHIKLLPPFPNKSLLILF